MAAISSSAAAINRREPSIVVSMQFYPRAAPICRLPRTPDARNDTPRASGKIAPFAPVLARYAQTERVGEDPHPYEYGKHSPGKTPRPGPQMEGPDLGHFRHFHDHPGFDHRQHCVPDAAHQVRRHRCAGPMGDQHLRAGVGRDHSGVRLSGRPLSHQTHLPAGPGYLHTRVAAVRFRAFAGPADRGARPPGHWRRDVTATWPGATFPRLPAEGTGYGAGLLRHCHRGGPGAGSTARRLAGRYQPLAGHLFH